MASHNNTPQTILDAPEKNVVVVEPHPGYSRESMRFQGARGDRLFNKPNARIAAKKKSPNALLLEIAADKRAREESLTVV